MMQTNYDDLITVYKCQLFANSETDLVELIKLLFTDITGIFNSFILIIVPLLQLLHLIHTEIENLLFLADIVSI